MSQSHVPDHAELPPPSLEEVSPGIFAYVQLDGTWFLNNCGFIVGKQSAVVIDTTSTEKRAHAFREAVRRTTSHPVQALVNTHSHGDHTHGNYLFSPETAIIAHDLCRDEVARQNIEATQARFPTGDFGNPIPTPPMVTFPDRLSVFVDDLRVELQYMGPAHTTNDVIAWIPERKVLFSGDLVFNGGTPFALAGSIAGWLEALPRLRALGAETIVPGHGAVCDASVFDTIESYLRFVQATAERGFEAGVPPLELARSIDLGEFAALGDSERIVGNLHRAYSELRGEPRGTALSPAAFTEMIDYNGGQPLRCLA